MQADLVDAVRRGVIGGATLDVTVDEPLGPDAFRDRFVDDFHRWKTGTLAGKSVVDHVQEIWGRLGESNPRPSHYE